MAMILFEHGFYCKTHSKPMFSLIQIKLIMQNFASPLKLNFFW